MTNMTIGIPEDLRERMRKHPEIKWSEVARRAIRKYAERLDELDRLTSGSRLDQEDIDDIDHKIKKGLQARYSRLQE